MLWLLRKEGIKVSGLGSSHHFKAALGFQPIAALPSCCVQHIACLKPGLSWHFTPQLKQRQTK